MMSKRQNLNYGFPVPRRQQRLRELIIHVAGKCEDAEYFGAVKLNKILYLADFRAFRRFGVPITGAEYFRLPKGPAPRALVPVRNELQAEGAIEIERRPMGNMTQERVVPLRTANLDLFTQDEIDLVDEVIRELWDKSAEQVSDMSHDIIWETRGDEDPIPYEAAYLSDDPLSEEEIARSHELAKQFGWGDR